ncbi:aromatic acid exporter family protein [Kitasatospora mediocidica]|uniref:aromatic acid exporter family protein n=1 Tax=Kitasatospora mediocidica TaxID=58352 RepID=UPI00055BE92B|nr:FUSC family protein [Kitasatospora mediocidica]
MGDSLVQRLRPQLPAMARILVASVLSWQIAWWLGATSPPVYAALVPLLALRSDPITAVGTSVARVSGVVIGVVIGGVVVDLVGPSDATLALVLGLALLVGSVLPAGAIVSVQVPVSALLVFTNTGPDSYAYHRLWETGVGAAVTIFLAPLLWPPDPRAALTQALGSSGRRLTLALVGSAALVGSDPQATAANEREVQDLVRATTSMLGQARTDARAMRYNPLRRRHRGAVAEQVGLIALVEAVGVHVGLLAREVNLFADRRDPGFRIQAAQEYLPRAARAAAATLDAVLAGDPWAQQAAATRQCLEEYRDADVHPIAVALRRPVVQILHELEHRPEP